MNAAFRASVNLNFHWGNVGLRYTFNGQEKEPEVADGICTAEYWEYDSRLGRRWNLDPVTKIGESSYATFSNNPINYTDPDGADTVSLAWVRHQFVLLRSLAGDIAEIDNVIYENKYRIDEVTEDIARIERKMRWLNVLLSVRPGGRKAQGTVMATLNSSLLGLQLEKQKLEVEVNKKIEERNGAVNYYNMFFDNLKYNLEHAHFMWLEPEQTPDGPNKVPIVEKTFGTLNLNTLNDIRNYYRAPGYSFTLEGWEYHFGGRASSHNTYKVNRMNLMPYINNLPVKLPDPEGRDPLDLDETFPTKK